MKSNLTNLFPSACISKKEMISYLEKNIDEKSLHKLEGHLQSCEYCSEAMHGLGQLRDLSALNRLPFMWEKKTGISTPAHKLKQLSNFIPGSISLLLVITIIIFFGNKYPESKKAAMVIHKNYINSPLEKKNIAIDKIEKSENNVTFPEGYQKNSLPINEIKSATEMNKIPYRECYTIDKASVEYTLARHLNSCPYKIVYMEDLKTVDYSKIYSDNQTQLDKLFQNVSAQFENSEQQKKKTADETVYTVKYETILATALRSINTGAYATSLNNFNLILQYFPGDMNCSFYKALTYERMERFYEAEKLFMSISISPANAFYEEAKWHLAIVKEMLNKTKEAKEILESIVSDDGFYKTQALEKLKEIKE